ncbi:RNA polymerase factor sigma-70 [compost metagenome]
MLVDILKYTAAESAELLNTTEGAVKGALHRARSKLRKLADNRSGFLGDSDDRIIQESHVGWPIGNDVVYAYLDALRQQNTAALIMLMNDASPLELAPVLCNQITHTNRLQEKKIATKPIESRLVHMVMAA